MNDKLLKAAREYIAQGISVIPTIGKIPAISSWKEFQTRIADEYDLQRWKDSVTATGLAAVTGEVSGFCVVDIDDLTQMSKYSWPDTVKAHSGRGIHLYFKYDSGRPIKSKSAFSLGMDMKAEGGLCTLPPSLHLSTGKEYAWEVPFEREKLADVPMWIRGILADSEVVERKTLTSLVWPNHIRSFDQLTHGMVQEAKEVLIDDILPEDLHLKTSGSGRMVGLCPFHDESTASFTLFLNSNSYYCFGCEKGGDVIDLTMNLRECSFKEAVLWLYRGEWIDNDEQHD